MRARRAMSGQKMLSSANTCPGGHDKIRTKTAALMTASTTAVLDGSCKSSRSPCEQMFRCVF